MTQQLQDKNSMFPSRSTSQSCHASRYQPLISCKQKPSLLQLQHSEALPGLNGQGLHERGCHSRFLSSPTEELSYRCAEDSQVSSCKEPSSTKSQLGGFCSSFTALHSEQSRKLVINQGSSPETRLLKSESPARVQRTASPSSLSACITGRAERPPLNCRAIRKRVNGGTLQVL